MTHTPGPWHAVDNGVVYSDGATAVCLLSNTASDADARLIAAAPELLEALRNIAAMATRLADSAHWPTVGRQIKEAARSAIYEAEGSRTDG